MLKVCVTGGRYYNKKNFLFGALDELHAFDSITHLAHGATPTGLGADWLADAWAELHNIPRIPFAVNHAIDGEWPSAGPRRNRRMLDIFKPDLLIAFQGDNGTRRCMEAAEERSIMIWQPEKQTLKDLTG